MFTILAYMYAFAVCFLLPSGFVSISALKTELRSVTQLYGKERGMNASLLSKIRALRGNIEVCSEERKTHVGGCRY